MTSSLISRELDSVNLDGISRLLSNLSKQVGRNQSMSRAEAVSLDRERQSLKNRYTSILVDLDFRFTRLKELLVPGDRKKPESEALGGVEIHVLPDAEYLGAHGAAEPAGAQRAWGSHHRCGQAAARTRPWHLAPSGPRP